MADQEDVRRIALSLPGASEGRDRFSFSVENGGRQKGFAWVWLERTEPKKPRVPRPDVLAVRVKDQAEKAALLAGDPERFFTEPHYNGFPAVLVRLSKLTSAQLQKLLEDAWPARPRGRCSTSAGGRRIGRRGGPGCEAAPTVRRSRR